MRRIAVIAAALVIVLLLAPGATEAARAGGQVRPPVVARDFPDPAVTRDGSTYYLYATNIASGSQTLNVPVARSADLDTWSLVGDALPAVGSWARAGFTWAPGVAKVGSKWLLYYTANDVGSGRQCVGRATSASPTGPFVDDAAAPLVCQLDGGGSIDASPFVDTDGSAWLVWKSDGNAIGADTVIWAQRLSADGRSLSGSPSALLRADSDWEHTIVEGPALVRAGGSLLLFYSGGLWDTAGYAIGYARCSSPAGPCTKATTSAPWLSTASGGVAGPGGPSFVTSPSGQLAMAFHGWMGAVGYQQGGSRDAFVEPVTVSGGVPDWRPDLPRTGVLHTPFGHLDSANGVPGGATIAGWAIDPDTAAPIDVHLYVDGRFAAATHADQTRADVGAAYPGFGPSHGFVLGVGLGAGSHSLCAYAINVGTGSVNPLLGCASVVVPGGLPVGNLEAVGAFPHGAVVSGWALDPDTAGPAEIDIYADGVFVGYGYAADPRADVGALFPAYGPGHGFSIPVSLSTGFHTVCAYAIDVPLGATNPWLGCQAVAVPGGRPFGSFEAIGLASGGAVVSGWAIDPDTAGPIEIDVYADGAFAGFGYASDVRPDVGAAFPGYGPSHGFSFGVGLSPGPHTVCAYAIDLATGPFNTWLGCRSITARLPFGNLEAVTAVSGGAVVSGWAIDPDTAAPVDVHVYVDGAFAGWGTASGDRPDVASAFPAYGRAHGFAIVVGASSGTHRVCAYAIDVGSSGVNPAVGCATVTL